MSVVEQVNVYGDLNPSSSASGSFEKDGQISGDTSIKVDITSDLTSKKDISGSLSELNSSISGNLSKTTNSISGNVKNLKSVNGNLHITGGTPIEDLGRLAYKDEASGTFTPNGKITITQGTSITKSVVASSPESTAPDNALIYYRMKGENLALYQLGYVTGDVSFTGTEETITVS